MSEEFEGMVGLTDEQLRLAEEHATAGYQKKKFVDAVFDGGQARSAELLRELEKVTRERDEARKWVRKLNRIIEIKGDRVLGLPGWLMEEGR